MKESAELAAETLVRQRAELEGAACGIAERLAAGGGIFCFGNGGSSTDAAAAARMFASPPDGRPFPAWDLSANPAVLTALANDVGFELVFARQLMAHANARDVALAFSTSGSSPDLLAAMSAARGSRMLTVAVCGTGGGRLATCGDVDHCLTVDSQSVHRIQEAQRAVLMELRRLVDECLETRVGGHTGGSLGGGSEIDDPGGAT